MDIVNYHAYYMIVMQHFYHYYYYYCYRQQSIRNYVSSELFDQNSEVSGDILVSYYLTSIYDHSVLEAFSKVVQKLVRQLPVLNSLLDRLIESCAVEKSYLLDVFTKLYVATDSVPVDSHTYELCSDLVDVVIDVSCIYGMVACLNRLTSSDHRSHRSMRHSQVCLLTMARPCHMTMTARPLSD